MDAETSFELIDRARMGDREALDRLMARYRPRLRRWASGRLPPAVRGMTDTEDIVQDVLLGTVRNLKTFEHREEWSLQAYLRTAVTNRVRAELRKQGRRSPADALPEGLAANGVGPLEAALGTEVFARYEAALEQLAPPEREAVIAKIELGCTHEEIALLIGKTSADAARMTVARAIQKVAAAMAGASE